MPFPQKISCPDRWCRRAAWPSQKLNATFYTDVTYTDVIASLICGRRAYFSQPEFARYYIYLTAKLCAIWRVMASTLYFSHRWHFLSWTARQSAEERHMTSLPSLSLLLFFFLNWQWKHFCINKFPIIANHMKADKSMLFPLYENTNQSSLSIVRVNDSDMQHSD